MRADCRRPVPHWLALHPSSLLHTLSFVLLRCSRAYPQSQQTPLFACACCFVWNNAAQQRQLACLPSAAAPRCATSAEAVGLAEREKQEKQGTGI